MTVGRDKLCREWQNVICVITSSLRWAFISSHRIHKSPLAICANELFKVIRLRVVLMEVETGGGDRLVWLDFIQLEERFKKLARTVALLVCIAFHIVVARRSTISPTCFAVDMCYHLSPDTCWLVVVTICHCFFLVHLATFREEATLASFHVSILRNGILSGITRISTLIADVC
jgi:hypothetical protein